MTVKEKINNRPLEEVDKILDLLDENFYNLLYNKPLTPELNAILATLNITYEEIKKYYI